MDIKLRGGFLFGILSIVSFVYETRRSVSYNILLSVGTIMELFYTHIYEE